MNPMPVHRRDGGPESSLHLMSFDESARAAKATELLMMPNQPRRERIGREGDPRLVTFAHETVRSLG